MTRLSEVSFKTLTECKKIRESLGGENHHEDQCKGIPAVLNEESFYYHRECYQKFTYARALLKRKLENENETMKSNKRPSRASSSTGAACSRGIFPKQCMICSKERTKVGGKFQFPTKILARSAEETLKNAAHLRNDQTMITAVTGIDLIAKEFSKHQTCYINYTRISRETKTKNSASSERDTTGDFQSVCNVIEKLVIGQQKCVSMETIVSAYGINEGDKQQRYRLKQDC